MCEFFNIFHSDLVKRLNTRVMFSIFFMWVTNHDEYMCDVFNTLHSIVVKILNTCVMFLHVSFEFVNILNQYVTFF